jgi:cysteinyl-tRNA synthetase
MVSLALYNTATRRKEAFQPIDPAHVRMYVCGPTVYDYAHIGNARPVVVFDVLARVLRRLFPQVTYVRNITDVDDKIIAAADATGETIEAVTARTADAYHADMAALGALPPDVEPRATAHIAEMIAMIETLVSGGHAYAADGHVLFSVASDPGYGSLSHRNRDDMIAGARVEVAPYKRDPCDFVLWKPSTDVQPGWDSPWGRGRPGWHIECSAMSEKYLGVPFDIHGGGQDLIFPHHENEQAQSTCAHDGGEFARVWVHNGFVTVEGEKMSKSLGNFRTVHDLLDRHPGEAIRFALLSTHYRQPLDWTEDGVRQARAVLDRWYRAAGDVAPGRVPDAVIAGLCDDLNVAPAIAEMHALADRAIAGDPAAAGDLKAAAGLLGLLGHDPDTWFKGAGDDEESSAIEALIEARAAARKFRDFAEADRIRAELAGRGVVLEDRPDGTTDWRRGT